MKKIYVAGPYSQPDPCANTHRAIAEGNRLMDAGHAPFVPHLTHLWHTVTPRPYLDWTRLDNAFLPHCDAWVRLPGHSPGADAEVRLAQSLGIPVFWSTQDCINHFGGRAPPGSTGACLGE